MFLLRTALEIVRTYRDCGVSTPFETLVGELLRIGGRDLNPSMAMVEIAFDDFRGDFNVYLATARTAVIRYPDLVAAEGGDR